MNQIKAERFFLVRRAGFGWSDRPDDAVPHADRERVVAGALIQDGLALLRDQSFDLDLIGFDVTELERLMALADSEGWVRRRRGRIPEPAENPVTNARRPLAPGHHRLLCGDATVLRTSSALDGQLANMSFCNPSYNVEYASTPKNKTPPQAPPDPQRQPRR